MVVVGLRELRQQASELVRRVEAGEEVTITRHGKEVVAAPRAWRPYSAVAELFDGVADADWTDDRQAVDDALLDRWPPA